MPVANLWPDFKIDPKPRGIRQMLEDAGQGLGDKTNGVVTFRVWPLDNDRDRTFPFRYRCDLHVAKLDYSYPLLYVNAAPAGFPGEVVTDANSFKVDDEPALLAVLERIFRSDRTVAIVQNLVSMATE